MRDLYWSAARTFDLDFGDFTLRSHDGLIVDLTYQTPAGDLYGKVLRVFHNNLA